MIQTEQNLTINASIDEVWAYAHDIERWANLMPGLQSCELIDPDNSRWTLKIGAGGMVRTVKVAVRVLEWAGPARVVFAYKLENDPVEGGGTYAATANGANATDVTLNVRVEGSGPMAPMWEAMGKPLLPTLAKGFAEHLKREIESTVRAAPRAGAERSWLSKLQALLRDIWQAIFKPAPEGEHR